MATPATYYFDEWLELLTKLKQLSLDDLNPMTFAGCVPKGYMGSSARILYVCASVPNWVADVFGGGPNPLKDDAAALDFVGRLGGLAGGSGDAVAVTALCKIGVKGGDVSPGLLLAQQQLAVQTLRMEMYALAPKLVVFACGGKYSAAIRESVNAARGSRADLTVEGEGNEAIGFRERGNAGEPAVLVLQPPAAFGKAVQAAWLAKAAALLR